MQKLHSKVSSKADYLPTKKKLLRNGFDTGATKINIDFHGNEIGFLDEFVIIDNGQGISLAKIDQTFGHFLDSNKTSS